ncbi:PTS fructose transporter subunit IIC [Rhodoluna limnophila]|uniref:PTS fructose transporter subunit IIC n=1 Tax=Rhodoluna limnophila TaxID=232537 RepID=UPI001FE7F181|nr:PTS fructose transporter subunit IIC [Rhodoluna limnophila]
MSNASIGTRIRQWLMTGVSYMIPFVAAGGILIALGFLLGAAAAGTDGIHAYDAAKMGVPTNEGGAVTGFDLLNVGNWAFIIFWLGKAAFAFFVPVLAGYIAFAIADRPGIAPGFVAGALATGLDGNPLGTGTGFLGAIAGGFIAGFAALWISRWPVANWIKPVMPVVVIPLLASIIAGVSMVLVLKTPIGALVTGLTDWLNGISTAGLVVLGIVIGLMMAFDMGGPVNKVAYTFGVTGLAAAGAVASATEFQVMAIVMAAGMTPPLGLALATQLRKKLFTESERENGKAAWLLGASFISEGAIPFAAADPIRVIPSIMLGSGVTGALVAIFGNELRAPHGGIFVFPLVSNALTYVLAILIGTAVTALAVIVAKGIGNKAE